MACHHLSAPDHLLVEIRVRPPNRREQALDCRITWHLEPRCMYELVPSSGRRVNEFTFDTVHPPEADTTTVYAGRAQDVVAEVARGFNATVFVYGQTSSGKTYTMSGSPEHPCGLVHLAVQDLWDACERCTEWTSTLRVSFLEIYNERERDLLEPTNSLSLAQGHDGVTCVGLKTVVVNSVAEVVALHEQGKSHREIGSTGLNATSSRSHAIFQIQVESRPRGSVGNEHLRTSLLRLVDLAGSERVKQAATEGQRKLEGSMINRSLLTLQKVIKALADCGGDRNKAKHMPLRESKLTRILDNSFGGNSKTLIICTVTPVAQHRSETLSVLQFAKLAKMIQNRPQVNEKLSERRLLRQCQEENALLRRQLSQLKPAAAGCTEQGVQVTPEPEPHVAPTRELALARNLDAMVTLYAQRHLREQQRPGVKRPRRSISVDLWDINRPTKRRAHDAQQDRRLSCPFAGFAPPSAAVAVRRGSDSPCGHPKTAALEAQLSEAHETIAVLSDKIRHHEQREQHLLRVVGIQYAVCQSGLQAVFTASTKERHSLALARARLPPR